jgi:hypothetical protein
MHSAHQVKAGVNKLSIYLCVTFKNYKPEHKLKKRLNIYIIVIVSSYILVCPEMSHYNKTSRRVQYYLLQCVEYAATFYRFCLFDKDSS